MSNPGLRGGRIAALDVLRGFALCGILLANVEPIAARGLLVTAQPGLESAPGFMGLLVHHRFLPIFSLLFGVGFALLFASAAGRTPRPRLLLLRRLLVLLAIGAVHFLLLWQGDILSTYAVVGLLVLLPATWLPRLAVAVLSVVLLGVSLAIGDGRFTLVAGLFLAGAALVRYDAIRALAGSVRAAGVPGAVLGVLAFAALWMGWDGLAALLTAGAYCCGVMVLMRTRARTVLLKVFEPLGRMALTNYLTATILVLIMPGWVFPAGVLAVAVPILMLQWCWSALWLRGMRQGPLEWLWRWATWGRRPPMRIR